MKTLIGHSDKVNYVSWSPDGSKLASESSDNKIIIWDTSDWSEIQTLAGHFYSINYVVWSPNGSKLASTSWDDNAITIWDTGDNSEMRTLTGHTDDINSVAWSPDGSKLASGSNDHSIKIWQYPYTNFMIPSIDRGFDINNPTSQIGMVLIIIGLISSSWTILAKRSFDRKNERMAITNNADIQSIDNIYPEN